MCPSPPDGHLTSGEPFLHPTAPLPVSVSSLAFALDFGHSPGFGFMPPPFGVDDRGLTAVSVDDLMCIGHLISLLVILVIGQFF